jgi:hypothetical protein
MGPINYAADVQSPLQAALLGYQGGAAIRADQQQQAAQAAALQQQKDLAAARNVAFQSPTADNFAKLMALDPKSSEAYQRAWTTKNTQQQQSLASDLLQWGAAIKSGKPEIAAQALADRADMIEQQNGGQPTPDSRALRMQSQLAKEHPQFALGQIQALLAANPNGKDAAETLSKFGAEQRAAEKAPAELRQATAVANKAESDAVTAAVGAKYADQKAVVDLQKAGWDIKKVIADIDNGREANRIAAMNAAANREGNALKREELKLKVQDARLAYDEKVRAKVADYEAGQATLQDALNLLTEIRADPDTLEAATGASAWRAAIPGTKTRTAAGKIEQLQNTLAVSNLDKLKGAMSDKDIAFLKNIASNLDRYQSESGFSTELGKVEQILIRADKQLRNKFGAPSKAAPAVPSSGEGTSTQQRNVTVDW